MLSSLKRLPWFYKCMFLGFAAALGFFLWAEHRAHVLGVLPYLIFLACPLMHLFMHGGHGHGGHHHVGKGGTPNDTR